MNLEKHYQDVLREFNKASFANSDKREFLFGAMVILQILLDTIKDLRTIRDRFNNVLADLDFETDKYELIDED